MTEWKQKRGDYPFQDWQIMPDDKDAPEVLWKQTQGDYPFKIWQDMPDGKDAPDVLWKQKQGSYPFKSWQKMPSMPNYAKKTTQIVVVPNCKTQTIISNQRKNVMIATGAIKTELQELSQGGSVDLSVRPIVKGSVLNSVGWDVSVDELATVYSSTYTSQDFEEEGLDIYAINVTPILTNGTVLSPSQLESAVHDIIVNEKDTYRIQMGDKFYGETISDAINQAETAAIRIHELHEECISKQPVYSNQENFKTYTIISMIDEVIT